MRNPLGQAAHSVLSFRSSDQGPTTVATLVKPTLVPAALAGLVGLVAQSFLWPEADVAWLLSVGRRMLAGEVLYSSDLIELNLPLVMQLSAGAVALGRWLRLDVMLAWRLVVAVLAVGSFTLTWRILRLNLADRRADMQSANAVLLAAALVVLPGVSFGQREHLVVLGMMPYLAAASARAEHRAIGARSQILVGGALALAAAIKPHYFMAVAFVELVVAFYRRSWRALVSLETLVAAGGLLVLVAEIVWLFPGYWSVAVPLALRYYGEYGDATLLRTHAVHGVILIGGLLITGVLRGVTTQSRVFAAAAIGSFMGYVLQGQGWVYQFLPAQTFVIMAAGLPALALALQAARRQVGRWSLRAWPGTSTAVLIGLVLMLAGLATVRTARANAGHRARAIAHVRALVERSWPEGRPRTMAGLTLSLFPSFPVAELVGAEWVSRFSCLWLLPGIEHWERQAGAGSPPEPGRQYLTAAIIDEFTRHRPTLVIAEREAPRVLDQMLQVAAFREIWRDYRLAGAVENTAVFVRSDVASPALR